MKRETVIGKSFSIITQRNTGARKRLAGARNHQASGIQTSSREREITHTKDRGGISRTCTLVLDTCVYLSCDSYCILSSSAIILIGALVIEPPRTERPQQVRAHL